MRSKKNKVRSKARKTSRQTGKPKTTKKSATKKPARKTTPKLKARNRKKPESVDFAAELRREVQGRNRESSGRKSVRRSEDFEGISSAQQADSESVDELLEEGNIVEAGAVAGVQNANDSDEREVRTREFPEDDVPEEYLDKD